MSRLLLIDGDGIVYRAGFATEKTKYCVTINHHDADGGLQAEFFESSKEAKAYIERPHLKGIECFIWSRKETEPVDKALMLTELILKDIKDRYADFEPRVFLSPSVGNYRDLIATRAKYKGNRDAAQKPTHHRAIREYLGKRHGAVVAVGQEADDELGIAMASNPGSVCVSHDKDLLQIPGTHYNWTTKEEVVITPKQGAMNYWTQVLTGDDTDNVDGVDGIGPVKAKAILATVKTNKEAESLVKQTYVDKYGEDLGNEYFKEACALLWVRRTLQDNYVSRPTY